MAKFGETVQGYCPRGCGQTLFLGSNGYVTCGYLPCPEPDAATKLLMAENTWIVAQLHNNPRKVED